MVDVRPLAEFAKGHASCAHRLHFETTLAFRAQDAELEDELLTRHEQRSLGINEKRHIVNLHRTHNYNVANIEAAKKVLSAFPDVSGAKCV